MKSINRKKHEREDSLQEIKKAYKRIEGLQHVTSELARAVTKSDVAKIIIEEGFKVMQADSGDVVLLEQDNDVKVVAYKGYPQSFFKQLPTVVKYSPPLLTMAVIRSKKPYFIQDVNELDKKYALANIFIKQVGARSAVLLPLMIEDRVVGVLEFTFHELQEFSTEDKNFMMTLAQQCAQAFERVTAQEDLQESKAELEIILKNIADGIIVQNGYGKVIYLNKVFASLIENVSEDGLLKKPWKSYLNLFDIYNEQGESVDPEQVPGKNAISGKKNMQIALKFVHKVSGRMHWLKIGSSVIPHTDLNGPCIVSVFQDITMLKELELRKDDFISMASHELKTPLTSAKVFTHVLKQRVAVLRDDVSARILIKLDRQLDQLNDLTKDLLDITKLQKGKLEMTKSRFALHRVMQEIVEDLQPSTEHPLRMAAISPVFIFADREKIAQVVTNFLTNAIKYSHNKTPITVALRKNTNDIIVSVKDRGIGILGEDVDKIFERFYRIEKDRKTYPGLGLGLYISSEIIRQHGGKIWVKSEKDKGSTFYFSLPLHVK